MQIFPELCRLNRALLVPTLQSWVINIWALVGDKAQKFSWLVSQQHIVFFFFYSYLFHMLSHYFSHLLFAYPFILKKWNTALSPVPTTLRSLLRKACGWGLESWSYIYIYIYAKTAKVWLKFLKSKLLKSWQGLSSFVLHRDSTKCEKYNTIRWSEKEREETCWQNKQITDTDMEGSTLQGRYTLLHVCLTLKCTICASRGHDKHKSFSHRTGWEWKRATYIQDCSSY